MKLSFKSQGKKSVIFKWKQVEEGRAREQSRIPGSQVEKGYKIGVNVTDLKDLFWKIKFSQAEEIGFYIFQNAVLSFLLLKWT